MECLCVSQRLDLILSDTLRFLHLTQGRSSEFVMKSDWSVFGSGKGSWERKRELLSRSMARYWWWWRWRWWWWWHLYYPKVNLFFFFFSFDFIFTFLQLDRDIKALKFDLNVTDVTLQSSVSALLFDVNHVNQTLKDQVCWENYLNVPQDVKLGVLTICVNHPGGNLVHKHKTIKSHSVEEWPASRYIQISWTD